jgi:hypothetical protein
MKIFLSAIALSAFAATLAVGGCSSDDSSTPAVTVLANVANGGECTQGVQCQSGVCGYAIAKTCSATAGVCIAQSTCAVRTQCPCGGGPAFSECDDGVYAGQAVTGTQSCVDAGPVDASVPPTSTDAGDSGGADAGDSGGDADHDSGATNDAGDDSGDAAHD